LKRLRLNVDLDPTTGPTGSAVGSHSNTLNMRFIVVYYKPSNGLPVSLSTFMYSHPDIGIKTPLLPFSVVNDHEYDVLFDRVVSYYDDSKFLQLDLNLAGKKTVYSGSTEFQDHVRFGGLYTICLAETGATYTSSMVFTGVLTYND